MNLLKNVKDFLLGGVSYMNSTGKLSTKGALLCAAEAIVGSLVTIGTFGMLARVNAPVEENEDEEEESEETN